MFVAPIVLFVYNRPNYTQRTLEALAANPLAEQSILYIYADGPKASADSEALHQLKEVRRLIRSQPWCGKVVVVEATENKGLSASIITGVTEVVHQHGRVIVLEDDLTLSPFFLQFMNEALNVYETEEEVWSVGGCNFFATGNTIPETFLIRMTDCLGWATWQRAWQHFEPDGHKLLQQLTNQNLQHSFNVDGTYDFTGMLEAQLRGENSSWAVRWQAAAFLQNKLTLYSKRAVTNHIGLGTDATHAGGVNYASLIQWADQPVTVEKLPIKENELARQAMVATFRKLYTLKKPSLASQAIRLKQVASNILPEKWTRGLRKKKGSSISWKGNYNHWEEAKAVTSGYEAIGILEKVKSTVLRVKSGEVAYERDSVFFDKVQYAWPLLACLLKIATENELSLNIIDFGGSLGSTYFQNRYFLASLRSLHWNVVEQPHFVREGNKTIADSSLHFYEDIEECREHTNANTLLLSGVLSYLETPHEHLRKFIRLGFAYLLIDRTAFIDGAADRLTVQQVPETIYPASYPAWFFSERSFVSQFAEQYELVVDFDDSFTPAMTLEDGKRVYWKGFFFKRKENA